MPSPRSHGNTTKRGAILDAAVELVLTNGYDGTSMDAVAAAAGVSKTTIYAHFPDKLALFKAVMLRAGAEASVDLDGTLARVAGEPPLDQIVDVLLHMTRTATAAQFLAHFRVLITETERRSVLTDGFDEQALGLPDVVTVLASLLEADAEANGYDLPDPVPYATALLRATVPALQLDQLMSDFTPTPEVLAEQVRFVASVFVAGLRSGMPLPQPPGTRDYPWGGAMIAAIAAS